MARIRNLYQPESKDPYKLSRSKIELFTKCPRCFYLDRRLGISRPSGPAFTLNTAVDALLKNEFDLYRAAQKPHPIMEQYHVDAVPFQHEDIDEWRSNFKGVQVIHKETNLLITGAVDDIWVRPNGILIVTDYKATAKMDEVTLDDEWKEAYKRQMEVYQWLLRGKGFEVDDTAYFVYANGIADRQKFENRLTFRTILLPYEGSAAWVPKTLKKIKACLNADTAPKAADDCEFCAYREEAKEALP